VGEQSLRIVEIVGARPQFIKLAPVLRAIEAYNGQLPHPLIHEVLVHTGQHYDYEMSRVFFEELKIKEPDYHLEIGSGSHAYQTGEMLKRIEEVLLKEKTDLVMVYGDTNSTLAGALAAAKLHIPVAHVEAGLRSFNRHMPEEINRILTDHCSDYLFAPTPRARQILIGEGMPREKVFVTGNTIVDAVYQNLEIAVELGSSLAKLQLHPRKYFLVTLHRQENVDNPARFAPILEGLDRIASEFNLPVIYPIHPRARKMMAQFGLEPRSLTLIEPLDFLTFLHLENDARLILTDSGGVQEEACILKIPCVTLRDNTERPETVDVGANILAGASSQKIVECVNIMLEREYNWTNPFGDGKAGERITRIITGAEHG